jgi:hypothetical protein
MSFPLLSPCVSLAVLACTEEVVLAL